nr:hypothetical protein HK105_002500 [Polyrhizophydium stewartii]
MQKQNKIAAREAAEAKARADAALAATRDQENAEFDEYAGQLIDEWRAAGKNVAPILMNLERDRPGFVRRRRGDMKTELNTFRRLGVIDSGIVFNLGIVINLKIVTVIGADHFMFHDG